MNLMEIDFSEIMRTFLTMSLSGSAAALFLFIIKPIIKDRLPKSVQYYMWFAVMIALILPLSKMVVLQEPSGTTQHVITLTPIYDIIQHISNTALEEPVGLIFFSQGEQVQTIAQTQSRFFDVAAILFLVWQFGMLVFLGSNIICYILFLRKLKKTSICASLHDTELLNKLSGKGYTPRLYLNPVIATPMLIGVFRPVIVLPDKKYVDAQLQKILLHELTHLRRYDIVVKWLAILVGTLHWFNPMIYFVRREISRACELACDETVIKDLDTDEKRSYGDTLIAVVANNTAKIPLSTTMCEDKKALKERLGAIMKHTNFTRKTFVLSIVMILLILFITFFLGASSSTNNATSGGIITYADLTPFKKEKLTKEIELKNMLNNYDKKNIVETWVYLGDSDNEITDASIIIVSHEEITNATEQEKIILLVSENLGIDIKNIYITYMDVKTFTTPEKDK